MKFPLQGMEVKKGDIIGFHCEGISMIPYDELDSLDVPTFAYELYATPQVGNTYNMRTLISTHNRQYSLSAVVRPSKLGSWAIGFPSFFVQLLFETICTFFVFSKRFVSISFSQKGAEDTEIRWKSERISSQEENISSEWREEEQQKEEEKTPDRSPSSGHGPEVSHRSLDLERRKLRETRT